MEIVDVFHRRLGEFYAVRTQLEMRPVARAGVVWRVWWMQAALQSVHLQFTQLDDWKPEYRRLAPRCVVRSSIMITIGR